MKSIDTPKINDNLEKITAINEQLYNKYNRHHVIKDKTFLFDPTIDPMSYFNNVEVIEGNNGIFKVGLGFDFFVLRKMPYWSSDEEYLKEQWGVLTGEIEISYDFEDSNIPNTVKVHHIFIKRMYSSRQQKFYYCVWTIKEYFSGENISMFDYGAEYSYQYHNTPANGIHKNGKLISLNSAKQFIKELISTYILILKEGYTPYRFNHDGIFINYQNCRIEWKFIDYFYCEKKDLDYDTFYTSIMDFQHNICWKLCTYTNYSNRKLSPNQHHPFWTGLYSLMKENKEFYSNENIKKQKTTPPSRKEFINVFQTFLNYVNSSLDNN